MTGALQTQLPLPPPLEPPPVDEPSEGDNKESEEPEEVDWEFGDDNRGPTLEPNDEAEQRRTTEEQQAADQFFMKTKMKT